MSTDYYFVCRHCKQRGGWYTEQGTSSLIESMMFIMKHSDKCGHEHIAIKCVDDLKELESIGYVYKEDKTDYEKYWPESLYMDFLFHNRLRKVIDDFEAQGLLQTTRQLQAKLDNKIIEWRPK